ncbi:hypothetical protein C8Q75DRAFT_752686 [Abortiporus biennis]|nr:hypothetical protein C8Q75DRAFT_752686 [Abortiporus biennis]
MTTSHLRDILVNYTTKTFVSRQGPGSVYFLYEYAFCVCYPDIWIWIRETRYISDLLVRQIQKSASMMFLVSFILGSQLGGFLSCHLHLWPQGDLR